MLASQVRIPRVEDHPLVAARVVHHRRSELFTVLSPHEKCADAVCSVVETECHRHDFAAPLEGSWSRAAVRNGRLDTQADGLNGLSWRGRDEQQEELHCASLHEPGA